MLTIQNDTLISQDLRFLFIIGKGKRPSQYLENFLNHEISLFDDSLWMMWRKSSSSKESINSDTPPNDVRVSLQKINGSVADLLQEFDLQWESYLRHSFINRQQSDYIKKDQRRCK